MGAKTIVEKLVVKPGQRSLLLQASPGYEERLGDLPENVQVERRLSPDVDVAQCFVSSPWARPLPAA